MNFRLVLHILGSLALCAGAAMIPSLGIAMGEEHAGAASPLRPASSFALCIAVCIGAGVLLRRANAAHAHDRITASEGFAVASLGWCLMALLGALPYLLIRGGLNLGPVEAVFESMSGFTTTGSSIFGTPLSEGGYGTIEELPPSLLFWRSLTHWLGGMGIVVLVLAILPALRAGGYQLFQAEVPGPTAERLQPRIRETAAILWGVYVLLSAAETLLLLLGGMSLLDALCHTFGTMATGGFSTRDASVGHYAQAGHPSALYFEIVINIFMFLAGCNFLLHYQALHGKVSEYLRSAEFRFYITVLGAAILLFTIATRIANFDSLSTALRHSVFQVISITTTTGFATTDTNIWPAICRFGLVGLMFLGGCAGSTGGGLKQVRILVCLKYVFRELTRLLRPQLANPIRVDGMSLEERLVGNIVGLTLLWLTLFAFGCGLLTLLLPESAPGDDMKLTTAVSAVAACQNNIGPGLGMVGSTANYHWMPASAKLLLTFFMLLGRLEVYSVIVVLLPLAWRR
jgi:trk system potassium uptake protein